MFKKKRIKLKCTSEEAELLVKLLHAEQAILFYGVDYALNHNLYLSMSAAQKLHADKRRRELIDGLLTRLEGRRKA